VSQKLGASPITISARRPFPTTVMLHVLAEDIQRRSGSPLASNASIVSVHQFIMPPSICFGERSLRLPQAMPAQQRRIAHPTPRQGVRIADCVSLLDKMGAWAFCRKNVFKAGFDPEIQA
jgi:hypothetical protein